MFVAENIQADHDQGVERIYEPPYPPPFPSPPHNSNNQIQYPNMRKSNSAINIQKSNSSSSRVSSNESKSNLSINPLRKQPNTQGSNYISGVGDDLLLMPTLAVGHKNSIVKQLQGTKRELRITAEGYYLIDDSKNNQSSQKLQQMQNLQQHFYQHLQQQQQQQQQHNGNRSSSGGYQMDWNSNNGQNQIEQLLPPHPVSKPFENFQELSNERTINDYNRLNRSASLSGSRVVSQGSISSSGKEAKVDEVEVSGAISSVTTGVAVEKESLKKTRGFFKKVFQLDNKKKRSQREVMDDTVQSSDTLVHVSSKTTPPTTPPRAQMENDGSISRTRIPSISEQVNHSPRNPQNPQNPQFQQIQQSQQNGATFNYTESIPSNESSNNEDSVVELMKNIPVISTVFEIIDNSTALSIQSKLALKMVFIVAILYEIQTVLNLVTGWSKDVD